MNHLLPGLRKFTHDVFPEQEPLFQQLSQGQHPHTLLITCSDSRIDPALVTQTRPGELFVVRNAGNIVPPYGASRGGEEAAIEFAIDGLGISNIVICGHSHCGAMAALARSADLEHLPSVASWLKHARATRRRLHGNAGDDVLTAVEENVLVQANNLKTHPAVSAGLRDELVRIYGWVYHFDTGAVTIYDPRRREFVPSTEVDRGSDDVAAFTL